MENVGNNLPKELVEEILTRLPCKSLIRFKCVCKHWYALVHDDTKFLSHHLSHFIKNQTSAATGDVLLRFTLSSRRINGDNCKLFSLSSTSPRCSAVEMITIPAIFKTLPCHIRGHANGIVCFLSFTNQDILLYNPLTREFRHLPPYTAEPLAPRAVGMGYDSFTNDFKVMRICKRRDTYTTYNVEQYSLSIDSWTLLPNTNAELFQFDYDSFAMCFKRTFYWWAWFSEDCSSVILALNMDGGVFQIVPKPCDGVRISQSYGRSLTVWNDSVSLVCSNYWSPSNVDIWVMVGFGSWTLMRTIKYLSSQVPKPLVFWKGNELLIDMSNGKIESYNVDTEEIKDVPTTKHTDGLINRFQAVNYVPSLVPLKREIYHV